MMKLMVLSRYCRDGASSRLRTMQYRPYLEAAGFEVEYASLFDRAYLAGVYEGRRSRRRVLQAYGRRMRQLRSARKADLIWLEKEALPWIPWALERQLVPKGIPVVADYDDAVFHRYDRHSRSLVRHLLGHKIDHVMKAATMVTAGNPYLAERARAAGARRIEIVPTVVDANVYRIIEPQKGKPPVIGWIGTPETCRAFVEPILPLLRDIAERHGAVLRLVGADPSVAGGCVEVVPWSEHTEVDLIRSMDIGIMPLTDTPWARGKCGYKLIQYMACGLPVVASSVGMNSEIVGEAEAGLLARDAQGWGSALGQLLENPDLRALLGETGRRRVERSYSAQVWGPQVGRMLHEMSSAAPRH